MSEPTAGVWMLPWCAKAARVFKGTFRAPFARMRTRRASWSAASINNAGAPFVADDSFRARALPPRDLALDTASSSSASSSSSCCLAVVPPACLISQISAGTFMECEIFSSKCEVWWKESDTENGTWTRSWALRHSAGDALQVRLN